MDFCLRQKKRSRMTCSRSLLPLVSALLLPLKLLAQLAPLVLLAKQLAALASCVFQPPLTCLWCEKRNDLY